jgi:hypothetical protein
MPTGGEQETSSMLSINENLQKSHSSQMTDVKNTPDPFFTFLLFPASLFENTIQGPWWKFIAGISATVTRPDLVGCLNWR